MSAPRVHESQPPSALTPPPLHAVEMAEPAELVPPPPLRIIDAWRGIAALWVVMLHACLPVIASRWPELQTHPLFAFSLHGQLGVTLFFVISGYCIASTALGTRRKPRPERRFMSARLRRIYPPYVAASVLVVLASTLLAALVRRGVLRGSNLASLDFFHRDFLYYFSAVTLTQAPLRQEMLLTVFWSLSYELAFYIIVAAVMRATSRASAPGFLWTLHGITFAALLWRLLAPQSCPFPLDLWPQFGLGALVLHVAVAPGRPWPKVAAGLAALLVLVQGWSAPWKPELGQSSPLAQALVCAAFAGALLVLKDWDASLARWRLVRFCAWVGAFSYSLYLTHLLVLGAASQLMQRLGVTPSTFWMAFFVEAALAILFARVFFAVCERPFIRARPSAREEAGPAAPPHAAVGH